MKREIDIRDISDGKMYELNDLVKADCGDCSGCSSCCKGMGTSIVLDPLDVFRLTKGLNCTFEVLLQNKVELNVVDGIVLPNVRMAEQENHADFWIVWPVQCSPRSALVSAVCSLLEEFMRTMESGIFSRFMNVRRKTEPR